MENQNKPDYIKEPLFAFTVLPGSCNYLDVINISTIQ